MNQMEVSDLARRLFRSHGAAAEAEAAQKAAKLEAEGKTDAAADWRRIRAAIGEMRPPHAS